MATVLPFVKDGKVTALAVTSTDRVPALPDVPALKEHPGLERYEMVNWFGLFAPATTPTAIIEKLNAAVLAALQKPKTRGQLEALGVYPSPTTPAEFKTFLQSETDKFGTIIAEGKITAE